MNTRRLTRVLAVTVALAAPPLTGSALAQGTDDPRAPGATGAPGDQSGPGMRRHGARGPGRMAALDPVVVEGPPAPAEFARIVELPGDKVDRYTQLYDRLMSSTRPQRDSLAAMRRDLREAFDQGDRDAARQHRGKFRPLAEELARQQASFDDALKPLLAEVQWKRYQHWRDDQRKQAEKARQARRRPA
jgi:hypothetical protein